MPFLRGRSSRVGYLGLAFLALVACQGPESLDSDKGVAEERQSAVVVGNSGGGPTDPSGSIDSLTTYAAKCDAATGIHVPGFDCTAGTQVPQGSSIDNLEHDNWVGGGTGGGRTPPIPNQNPPTTAESITAAGLGIGGLTDQFYFSYLDFQSGGRAEVKVTSLSSSPSTGRAGLMIRQTGAATGATDVNALLAVTPTGGIVFQHRDELGKQTFFSNTVAASFPIWLRLTWSGTGVLAQWSSNHTNWTQVGAMAPMANLNYGLTAIGLAVASGNGALATTAGFDKFMTTKACDRPNILNSACEPNSTFQVLVRTADAIAVANCRKGSEHLDNMFSDIAVIQYNRKNGAVCFYQSPRTSQSGVAITPPLKGNGPGMFPWLAPKETHAGGCTSCHDNGALIRSPYLWQTGLLPSSYWAPPYVYEGYENDGTNPLAYVGADFAGDHSWAVNAPQNLTDAMNGKKNCNECHQLAVNDVFAPIGNGVSGTAHRFAEMATSEDQTVPNSSTTGSHKNPVSSSSPLWMRPNVQFTYDSAALLTAQSFKACAQALIDANYDASMVPASLNCSYQPYGSPYVPPITALTDLNVPATLTGSSTGTLAFATLNAPANTDIYDTSDAFFWSYVNKDEDGTAIVKVTSLTPVTGSLDPYAKAGIMVRDGVGANAVNVTLAITGSQGATFQYRPAAGAATPPPAFLTGRTVPIWLRLSRSGNTFVGAVSSDSGTTWAQVGAPVTLPTMVAPKLGLVATAHRPSTGAAKATFESFDWTKTKGWTDGSDPHILVDASIGPLSTGGRTESKTVDTVSAKGGDITGSTDVFQYAFKSFAGDGVAITKVTSQVAAPGAIDQYAKAGLMVRETAADNAANVFLGKTPFGATIQQRKTPGATTTPTNLSAPALPVWFRLLRTGNTFIGSMSADGTNWTQVGDPAVFTTFNTLPLVGLAVSSRTNANTTTATFDSGLVPEPPGFQWLPGLTNMEWLDASMGMPGGSHTSDTAAHTETITASGADIYNYADQFFYAWKNVTGNATITVQVSGLVGYPSGTPNAYAKAGVMFRDSATGGAPNAFMTLTAAQGASFQYRSTPGGLTPVPTFVPAGMGSWVRVVRSGAANNVYTGYVSANNVNWTQVGTVTMGTVAQTALVGLAVTSHDATKSVKATFSNFLITQP